MQAAMWQIMLDIRMKKTSFSKPSPRLSLPLAFLKRDPLDLNILKIRINLVSLMSLYILPILAILTIPFTGALL